MRLTISFVKNVLMTKPSWSNRKKTEIAGLPKVGNPGRACLSERESPTRGARAGCKGSTVSVRIQLSPRCGARRQENRMLPIMSFFLRCLSRN